MKRISLISVFLVITVIFLIKNVSAHCPLCTAGAGAAAAAAVWLGISKVVVVLFIGAFSMSMGMWFSRIIKKQYIPFQKPIVLIIVFLATLLPLLPFFKAIGVLYIPFLGGTTYLINYSLFSSLIGAVITFFSPSISKKITEIRKKHMPYQSIIIALTLLLLIGGGIQLIF